MKLLEGLFPSITVLAEFRENEEWKLGPEDPRGFVLKTQRNKDSSGDKSYKFTDFDRIDGGMVKKTLNESAVCTYLCIQGIGQPLIITIGCILDVPPEFFAKHVVAQHATSSLINPLRCAMICLGLVRRYEEHLPGVSIAMTRRCI